MPLPIHSAHADLDPSRPSLFAKTVARLGSARAAGLETLAPRTTSPRRETPWNKRLRSLLAGGILLGATLGFGRFLDGVRPLRDWLFFDLAKLWAWDLLLTVACASAGHCLLVRVFRLGQLPALEKLSLALPLGLVTFVAGIYLAGFLALLGPVFAVVMPLTMLAIGIPDLYRAFSSANWRARPVLLTPLAWVFSSFGAICVGIVYLGILSPDSINYDAGWNHLVIAQDNARAGRVLAFPGDWVKNVPHLGSIVNTWAFLVPGLDHPVLRWMQAQHTEFTIFLWTLVGVAASVRFLAERSEVRAAWAAFFLFPSIFVYDSNLGVAADHFLALFAVPMLMASMRFLGTLGWREGVLLGVFGGAALLTKLQAVYVLVPIGVAVMARAAQLVYRRCKRREGAPAVSSVCIALASCCGAMLLLTLLHFGKNAAVFGNPFFPLAQGRFPSKLSSVPDAQLQMDYLFADWRWHPPTDLFERVRAAAEMVFTFSFVPHYTFVGNVPLFGSLFTLSLPLIFFIGRARRLWLGAAVGTGALLVWAMTFWVDRNLQTFLPLLVAVTAATLVRLWELGSLARVGVSALVALQVVWGADYYFSGSDRIANAMSLIRSGMEGRAENRFSGYRQAYIALGDSLPEEAVVLLHAQHVMLGINRPVLLDVIGFQGLVDYRTFRSPRDIHQRYRQLGVTHVVWSPGLGPSASKQEDVLFALYSTQHLAGPAAFGGFLVAALPKQAPRETPPLQVLSWNVPNYRNGLYPIEALSVCELLPPRMQRYPSPREEADTEAAVQRMLASADAAIISSPQGLSQAALAALETRFPHVTRVGSSMVYATTAALGLPDT